MSDEKVNYYQVMQDTAMHELDEINGIAFPVKNEQGKKWIVDKDQYVKSFGQLRTLKNTDKVKETYLILVNGNGVILKDVTLFQDEVDDCGCDMMPIAKPTDMQKLEDSKNNVNTPHKSLNKDNAYVNKKGRFDSAGIIGFILGGLIVGGIVWFKTKDKKKAILSAIGGAVIGMVVGYLIGRRGTKKMATLSKLEETQKLATNPVINEPTGKEDAKAENQDFLQLGESYDLVITNPVYAMLYADNTFYVARDKNNEKIKLKPNSMIRGKLVEVKEPEIFVLDSNNKKITKVKNKKPLPFLEIGKDLYIPLALLEKGAAITTEEANQYLNGQNSLEDEIYVKGRYAGKKYFYLMYSPNHNEAITKLYGQ